MPRVGKIHISMTGNSTFDLHSEANVEMGMSQGFGEIQNRSRHPFYVGDSVPGYPS